MKANASFKPFKPKKVKPVQRNIRYICSPERYDVLADMADKHGISLQKLVAQMVDFALENSDG